MKKDSIKLLIVEFLLCIILFIALIVSNKVSNILLAVILVVFMFIIKILFKKKNTLAQSIYTKDVNYLIVGFAILYLGIFYLLGLLHYDFVSLPIVFGFKTLYRYIIPITLIVISTEVIRKILLSQKIKLRIFKYKIDISMIIAFIINVLVDLIIYTKIYDITNLSDMLMIIGFILFSSISCNLFFNYITNRYGIKGIIIYRIITSVYMYIIPIIPDMYIYFRTFLRMLYPYLMYLVIEKTYSKNLVLLSKNARKKNFMTISLIIVTATITTMLISCEFKYGVLVIGSGSMKGTIDVGDIVFFESYDNQQIENGQIIIFSKNGIRLVHRVIDIKNVNGELRYYTKGDNNREIDTGYITKENIIGLTKFRVAYLGYPSLMVKDLFE